MGSLTGHLLLSNASLFDPNFRRTVVLIGHHDEEGAVVQPEAAVVVADFEDPSEAGVVAFDSIGFLAEKADLVDRGTIRRARVFAGYSGWGPGQLEAELDEEAWIVTPAMREDVFHDEPERLWDAVLSRLGPGYAILRTMPFDPSAN